jgi:hypothetical protein
MNVQSIIHNLSLSTSSNDVEELSKKLENATCSISFFGLRKVRLPSGESISLSNTAKMLRQFQNNLLVYKRRHFPSSDRQHWLHLFNSMQQTLKNSEKAAAKCNWVLRHLITVVDRIFLYFANSRVRHSDFSSSHRLEHHLPGDYCNFFDQKLFEIHLLYHTAAELIECLQSLENRVIAAQGGELSFFQILDRENKKHYQQVTPLPTEIVEKIVEIGKKLKGPSGDVTTFSNDLSYWIRPVSGVKNCYQIPWWWLQAIYPLSTITSKGP